MLSLRRLITLVALSVLAPMASAQTGPMLTPSAFIQEPGYFGLDVLGLSIGKEPNYLTFAESGANQLRTRIDGPIFRLHYVPSERAEFSAEINAQTFAINDPRYGQTISDVGDATLRAKLGLAKGESSARPAAALQFEVSLPNTSFGNGLGPNTIRLAANFLLGYQTERFTLNGSAGIAIQDEPLRQHEQRDFAALSASIAYKASESVEIFADSGGYFGDGVPGAIAKREARLGIQHHRDLFGRPTSIYLAGRRGLVTFQGKWGVVFGLTTAIRQGSASRDRVLEIPAMVDGTIAGIVTSSQYAPQPGAEVSLRVAEGGAGSDLPMSGQTTLTDGEGRFRFEHLPPGRYELNATLGPAASSAVEVSLYAGETREYLRLELEGSPEPEPVNEEPTEPVTEPATETVTEPATEPATEPVGEPSDVKMGGTLELRPTADFLAGGSKSAELVSLSGAPVTLGPDGTSSFALSALNQRIENLAPGSYRLVVEGGIEKTFDIVEGGTAIVDIP